jgi:peptidyl-prolyl cis-trans isomerase SurA
LAAAKKLTKKVKYEDWATTIVKALNNDSVKLVRIDRGIFKPGDSKAVDKFVFKTTKEVTPMKDYPFTDVLGKRLKAPETYADVKALVTADYQAACEREWVEELRKTYTFSVDEDVLRTVNAHGDKEK